MARTLKLEAVRALIGWEFSGGRNHPVCVTLKNNQLTINLHTIALGLTVVLSWKRMRKFFEMLVWSFKRSEVRRK